MADERFSFQTECPRCGAKPFLTYGRVELRALLQGHTELKFYCGKCDLSWDAPAVERANIAKVLGSADEKAE
jgi:ribosomal protein S27AE